MPQLSPYEDYSREDVHSISPDIPLYAGAVSWRLLGIIAVPVRRRETPRVRNIPKAIGYNSLRGILMTGMGVT